MKHLNHVLFILSVLAAPLAAASNLDQNESGSVGVYLSYDGPVSDRALDAMVQEVEELIHPAGFQLHWRLLDRRRSDESFSNLVVVTLHGKCSMADTEEGSHPGLVGDDLVLGSTRVSDGQILPFSDVECDRIRRSIAALAAGNSPAAKEWLLGRAMGRVLAHELFHVFGNTFKHGHEGVAKTSFSPRELVGDRFKFAVKDAGLMERH